MDVTSNTHCLTVSKEDKVSGLSCGSVSLYFIFDQVTSDFLKSPTKTPRRLCAGKETIM